MSGLVGRTLGRYEIVSLLGAGGMGEVYRAKDNELKRQVAIKIIPEIGDGSSHQARRFSREIRAVAALAHPNIVRLHDFGSVDGFSYAVMELLKGNDQRQQMRRRPFLVDRSLEIGIEIAHGLGEAHHHRVLHRDIKPENIFVTSDGVVKILDFGLARSIVSSDPEAETLSMSESLTSPGAIVGTTGYQSPEQVRGLDLDQRSDIFSLGCVLYEMLAGLNPFRRDTRVDTLSAILEHQPEPLSQIRPTLPPALDHIVDRCLQKDADQRFDSARDVAFALQALSGSHSGSQPIVMKRPPIKQRAIRWAAGVIAVLAVAVAAVSSLRRLQAPAMPANPHVAVVPFDAPSGDNDLDLVAAGFSEALALDLARLEDELTVDFWVVPPSNIRDLGATSVADVRRLFNTNIVLTGTVEGRESRLLIRISAVDPLTGLTIRETTIDDERGNVSTFQTLPVRQVAEMMDLDLPEGIRGVIEDRATNVSEAFEAYIRGRGTLSRASDQTAALTAVELLETANEHDPVFPAAREALAAACRQAYSFTGDVNWLDRGLEEADRAVVNRPSAVSYRCLGSIHRVAGRHREAAEALERALELTPNSGATRFELGVEYQSLGRIDAAERELLQSSNLRPGFWPGPQRLGYLYFSQGEQQAAANAWRQVVLSAPEYDGGYLNLGIVSHLLGRLEDAREYYEKAIGLAPDTSYDAYANLGAIYFDEARFADAIVMFEQALSIHKNRADVWGSLGYSCAYSGQSVRAEDAFRRAIDLAEKRRRTSADDPELLSDLAGYYAMVGERETSFRMLDRAVEIGTRDPRVLATIGETYEDLGEREAALRWIGRALEAGIAPENFANKPTLRGLIDDERYRQMIKQYGSPRATAQPAP